jgi:hypothetical protein
MTGQKTQCDRIVETLERDGEISRNQSRTFPGGNDNQFREIFDHTAENGRVWFQQPDSSPGRFERSAPF